MQQAETPAAGRAVQKIVVIDDDPTGSQTVHGCPLLLRWDREALLRGLRHPSPLLFLLANTRALDPAAARARVQEICRSLGPALAEAQGQGWIGGWQLVSRGDSTLRGHYPLEVDVLAAELGPFDATFLVPAFLEGGRTTVDGVHLLHGRPVHESPFARDGLFGFRHSDLPAWVEEKSGGRVGAASVRRLGRAELEAPPAELRARLASLAENVTVAVDVDRPQHLRALAAAMTALSRPVDPAQRPRRFLAQSAAGLVGALADLPPQPLAPPALAALRRRTPAGPLPGLVLVGSHVPLADRQLARLLADRRCGAVELAVPTLARALAGPLPDRLLPSLEAAWMERLRAELAAGRTPVLHTSRGEVRCARAGERIALGLALAAVMARLAAALAPQLGYLISKGGITTHTLLAEGLALDSVQLQGQLLPGLSLVLAGRQALPLLTFPGNLGDDGSLWEAWRRMEGDTSP